MSLNLNHATNKQNGDRLTATEWNNLAADVNTLGAEDTSSGGTGGGNSNVICTDVTEPGGDPKVSVKVNTGVANIAGDSAAVTALEFTKKTKNSNYKGTNVSLVSNNNINIEPRESVGTTKGGNISFKPGDDIELCSHHRLSDNLDEVSVKVIDGDENPVKLQLNAGSLTLTTKGKQGNDANVFDINVNSNKNTKGYLKVRAQAIDLRCEAHGGIALQPKGEDSLGHMNKIKFEHGGGDGLEFGTFNTEHTSLFTDDYRFNKYGVIKLASRKKTFSDKIDGSVSLVYVGQSDVFDQSYEVSDNNNKYFIRSGLFETSSTYTIEQVRSAFLVNSANFYDFVANCDNNETIGIAEYDYNDSTQEYTITTHHVFRLVVTSNDDTTKFKYIKNTTDDFYDFVDNSDPTCTWGDIVKFISWAKTNKSGKDWASLWL